MAAKGVNVPFGLPAKSVAEAVAAAKEIGDEEVVIKSQILAGGRGLGTFTNGFQGGVHVIKSSQVAEYADKMLGQMLVTKQSGPAGKPVDTLLIAKKMNLVAEKYFAILLDRSTMGPLIIACPEGGTVRSAHCDGSRARVRLEGQQWQQWQQWRRQRRQQWQQWQRRRRRRRHQTAGGDSSSSAN
jgi:hypothetical protein